MRSWPFILCGCVVATFAHRGEACTTSTMEVTGQNLVLNGGFETGTFHFYGVVCAPSWDYCLTTLCDRQHTSCGMLPDWYSFTVRQFVTVSRVFTNKQYVVRCCVT
eukprot:m.75044 g.75044  ORF g.75044 m.75044 type:complete len:106 (+) comp16165_c0_seq9:293-610(+)